LYLVAREEKNRPMSKGAQIGVAALSVFIGIALLLTYGGAGEGTFAYYSSVSDYVQANRKASSADGRDSRIHGFVLEGSIQKNLAAGHVDFVIRDGAAGATLPVRLVGIDLPDLFRDGAEVVVEGNFQQATFVARRVLAKCPSKYEVAPGTEA
jgi:cytochrome c-type biogenesis protein CcmE